MKKQAKKEVTNNDLLEAIVELGEATAHGFDKVHARLTEHDTRFNHVDRRMDDLQHQFTRIEDTVLKNHEHRIQALEAKRT